MPQKDQPQDSPGPQEERSKTAGSEFPLEEPAVPPVEPPPVDDSPAPRLDEEFVLEIDESDNWLLMDDASTETASANEDLEEPTAELADAEVAAPEVPPWLAESPEEGIAAGVAESMNAALEHSEDDSVPAGEEASTADDVRATDEMAAHTPRPAWLEADSAAELSAVDADTEVHFHADSVADFDVEEDEFAGDTDPHDLKELDLHPDLIQELEADLAAASVSSGGRPGRVLMVASIAAVLLVGLGYLGLYLYRSTSSEPTPPQVAAVPAEVPVAKDPEPAVPEPTETTAPVATSPETTEAPVGTGLDASADPTPPSDPVMTVPQPVVPEPSATVAEVPETNPTPPLEWPGTPDTSADTGNSIPASSFVSRDPVVVQPDVAKIGFPSKDSQKRLTSSHRGLMRGALAVIRLQNGHVFRGQVKRLRQDKVTLSNDRAEFTFSLDEIQVIDPSSSEYSEREDLPAASVTLINGQRLRGKLVDENATTVVLRVDNGRIKVPRSQVQSVSLAGRVHF